MAMLCTLDTSIKTACTNLWLQVLKLLQQDVHQLRADLKKDERDTLIHDFDKDPDRVKILICSYMVSASGLNLHGHCRTVIEFEPAPSEGIRKQVLGRVQRIGQKRWVRHVSLMTKNSFNTRQEASSLLKSLPALMTQLNMEVWGASEGEDDRDIPLEDWVVHEGDLVPADDERVAGLELETLDPDNLLYYIQLMLLGRELVGDVATLKESTQVPSWEDALRSNDELWAEHGHRCT